MTIFLPLYKLWIDKFYYLQDKGFCPYAIILNGTVAKEMLYKRYKEFTETEDVPKIESLPKERKEFYWSIALKLNPPTADNETKIKTAKACYVLSLITSNE